MKRRTPDRLLILGDILYHGPRNDLPEEYAPKKVMAMLNPLREKLLCVRGNCDGEVDQMVLDFPIMAEYAVLTLGNAEAYATHGITTTKRRRLRSLPAASCCTVTRMCPCATGTRGFVAMNPGSVSIPKEGSAHSCMLWENGVFRWLNLEDGSVYRECSF